MINVSPNAPLINEHLSELLCYATLTKPTWVLYRYTNKLFIMA